MLGTSADVLLARSSTVPSADASPSTPAKQRNASTQRVTLGTSARGRVHTCPSSPHARLTARRCTRRPARQPGASAAIGAAHTPSRGHTATLQRRRVRPSTTRNPPPHPKSLFAYRAESPHVATARSGLSKAESATTPLAPNWEGATTCCGKDSEDGDRPPPFQVTTRDLQSYPRCHARATP